MQLNSRHDDDAIDSDNSLPLDLNWRVYKGMPKFLTHFLKHELPKESLLTKQSKKTETWPNLDLFRALQFVRQQLSSCWLIIQLCAGTSICSF